MDGHRHTAQGSEKGRKKSRAIIDWYIMKLQFSQIVHYEILWNDLVLFQIVDSN